MQTVATSYKYDAVGRRIEVIDPANRVTFYVYNADDQVTETIEYGVVSNPLDFTPDATNIPSSAIVTKSVYNSLDQQVATIDALGKTTNYQYDDAGRVIAITAPSISASDTRRPQTEYHYDSQGHQTYVITNIYLDPNTNEVHYVTKNADGSETDSYRNAGESPDLWPTDAGEVTQFGYDSQGRQTARTLPNGLAKQTVYNDLDTVANGEVMYTVDFNGRVTAYDYDNSATGGGRVQDVRYYNSVADYNAGSNLVREISYTYDAYGRQVTVADSAFSTPTNYTYDIYGHLIEIDSPHGNLHYAYNNLGQQIATWTGSAATLTDARASATTLTEYTYDQLGRLASTKATREFGANVGTVDSTVYSVDGTIDYEITTTPGHDLVKAYSYDSFGRVSEIIYFDDANENNVHDIGEAVLKQFDYTYNKDNTRASEIDHEGVTLTATINWTYNGEGETASEDFNGLDDSGNTIHYTDTYFYDLSGNRISLQHVHVSGPTTSDGASYTTTSLYDANDRLLSEAKDTGGSGDTLTVYGYTGTDQTSQTVYPGLSASGSATTTTNYTYDVTGAMTRVDITTGSTTQSVMYKYDEDGNRVERIQGSTTTVYLIDPSNPTGYSQVIEEGTDTNGNSVLDASEVLKTYTLGGGILAQATTTQILHLLTDAHGSTRGVVNTGATTLALLQRYAYTAYGVDLAGSATLLTAIRYAGQMIDALTGLSFNRTRWYDPSTGTFTTMDPKQGNKDRPLSLNHYLYGNGNPITTSDPTGGEGLAELLVSLSGVGTIEKGNDVYKNVQAGEAVAKDFVRIAFAEMFVLSQSKINGPIQESLQIAYYVYEEIGFEKRYRGSNIKGAAELAFDLPKLTTYVGSLPGVAEKIPDNQAYTSHESVNFLTLEPGDAIITTFIPLTGSYTEDRVLSWAMYIGMELSDIGKVISGLDSGTFSFAGLYSSAEGILNANWSKLSKQFEQTIQVESLQCGCWRIQLASQRDIGI